MNDFIMNGSAHGGVATRILQSGGNIQALRPYVGKDGRTYITTNSGGELKAVPVHNVEASLRKDDWKVLDKAIIKAAQPRLKFVGDLRARGLTYNVPNGMAKTILETENVGDINDAITSMDGIRQGANDRPIFDLVTLPLPIIHKDFSFSARQIAASRNGGSPLDTTMAELAARKVAESVEKLALGVSSTYTYGGGTIYGLTNYTNRTTRTITAPTASGWTGATLLGEVLSMRQDAQDDYYYGPYHVYISSNWDKYLDNDYSTAYPNLSVRDRLKMIEGINGVTTLDYLENFDIVLVQMTTDVIREVIGMDITTLQWETQGGMLFNFKVMAILVPQIRADQNSRCGVVHGSTA